MSVNQQRVDVRGKTEYAEVPAELVKLNFPITNPCDAQQAGLFIQTRQYSSIHSHIYGVGMNKNVLFLVHCNTYTPKRCSSP
jgi:hypothetical protein